MKIPKAYNIYAVNRFIFISEYLIMNYEQILASKDIRTAYLIFIGDENYKICGYVGRFKLSCRAVCPFYVLFGMQCNENARHYKLFELTENYNSRITQEKILKNAIQLHRDIISGLEKIKKEIALLSEK